ncbi:hypothetical protein N8T08_000634 [Aspergillus melleus]|uniref:Uncharacterized protein n=1 Tax=Aspergillus melleus TaxID=138277 RepID=A0ACC3APG8_9EURO|nr:hypothetical protein N8T08_000634 [Aspergillus melleus]
MRHKLQNQPTLEESSAKLQEMPPSPSSSARRTSKAHGTINKHFQVEADARLRMA